MTARTGGLRHSLLTKIFASVSLTLLAGVAGWTWFNLHHQRQTTMEHMVTGADRLSNTIRLASHYAMLHNSRDDLRQIIRNVGRQRDVEAVRIYDKHGTIQFSSIYGEVGQSTNIKAEACDVCHRETPPRANAPLDQRTRIFTAPSGARMLGILTPIHNEPSCSGPPCHFHPPDKTVLGAMDMVLSLREADAGLAVYQRNSIALAALVFLFTTYIILLFVLRFVKEPVLALIQGTRLIARGEQIPMDDLDEADEMGQLVAAINRMGRDISAKQAELNRQRDEYQGLFETVPCLITVQDRNYRLLQYNREFAERFAPQAGDFCFHAYKGRDERCENCPVEKTFRTGRPHFSEEAGYNKDGSRAYWLVHTKPIRNERGEVVAAMEMCLDITQRKMLEEKLERSENKYHAIFNQIPNPVFVLDRQTLDILDCNDAVLPVYGHPRERLLGTWFPALFAGGDPAGHAARLRSESALNQVRHLTSTGRPIYVDISLAASEYAERPVLLAISRDITHRLETEQQLIQASKMATLGEMSTGVAHELNQPLSVIRTISGFFMRKLRKKEPMDEKTFILMAEGIDQNVERAARIIEHMREFGRKSGLKLERVRLDAVLRKAFDIFEQQFRVRGIVPRWELAESLPPVLAEPNRLEQVVINLLINARDAIEEKRAAAGADTAPPAPSGPPVPGTATDPDAEAPAPDEVRLRTMVRDGRVIMEVEDTGTGFPPGIAENLFVPFFTTKEVGKGTGLGLSISYGIVKDYGGTIQAESLPGGGARLRVEFPPAPENGRDAEGGDAPSGRDMGSPPGASQGTPGAAS
jgi:histidine kinase